MKLKSLSVTAVVAIAMGLLVLAGFTPAPAVAQYGMYSPSGGWAYGPKLVYMDSRAIMDSAIDPYGSNAGGYVSSGYSLATGCLNGYNIQSFVDTNPFPTVQLPSSDYNADPELSFGEAMHIDLVLKSRVVNGENGNCNIGYNNQFGHARYDLFWVVGTTDPSVYSNVGIVLDHSSWCISSEHVSTGYNNSNDGGGFIYSSISEDALVLMNSKVGHSHCEWDHPEYEGYSSSSPPVELNYQRPVIAGLGAATGYYEVNYMLVAAVKSAYWTTANANEVYVMNPNFFLHPRTQDLWVLVNSSAPSSTHEQKAKMVLGFSLEYGMPD